MSDPIVTFDEEAMRGELKELVRRALESHAECPSREGGRRSRECRPLRADGRPRSIPRGHYERSLATTSGQVTLRMPKLKGMRFARAIIERCRRREAPVKEVSGRVAAGQVIMPKRMGRS